MTDKNTRQEHLGEYSRDFAVFLPAISNFYNTFISKQRVTEGAHIPAERIPKTFEHGVESLLNGTLASGVYNKDTYDPEWKLEAPRTPKVDLSKINYPDYTDFQFSQYPKDAYEVAENTLGVASLFIEGTRSCIFDCKFCNVRGEFGVYRARPGEDVAKEIIYYYETYGVADFVFVDNKQHETHVH